MAAKKKKRSAPKVKAWVAKGCEGVTKDGRLKKGWRVPAKSGDCPRPGKGGSASRTKSIVKGVKACSPLFRKAVGTGFKRGYTACEKMLPNALRVKVHAKRPEAEDMWTQVAKAAAAQQAKEKSDRDWATSHGIPTLGRPGRRRRRR